MLWMDWKTNLKFSTLVVQFSAHHNTLSQYSILYITSQGYWDPDTGLVTKAGYTEINITQRQQLEMAD